MLSHRFPLSTHVLVMSEKQELFSPMGLFERNERRARTCEIFFFQAQSGWFYLGYLDPLEWFQLETILCFWQCVQIGRARWSKMGGNLGGKLSAGARKKVVWKNYGLEKTYVQGQKMYDRHFFGEQFNPVTLIPVAFPSLTILLNLFKAY